MALTAEQVFDLVAPAYASDPAKAAYLAMADELTSPSQFGAFRAHAVAYRAAHDLILAKDAAYAGGSSSGAVTSKREGDLSVSYGTASTASQYSDLATTVPGRKLIELLRASGPMFGVTGGSCGC